MDKDRTKNIVYFFLLVTVIGLNIHLRLFPGYFPQFKQQAAINAGNTIVNETVKRVNERYTDFNPLIKTKIIKRAVKEARKNKQEFKKKIIEGYKKLKGKYQDENGQTYLSEVDPYCWMRFTRFVLENGYPGNKKIGNKVYDTFMLAPQGKIVRPQRFLFYFSAFLYKISSFILPGLSLEKFLFYLPVFFSLIFFIVLYLFSRCYFSRFTGIFAVFFAGLSLVFIDRSSGGWFDTDVLNILFPLLVIWCLGAALKNRTFLRNVFFSLLSSFFLSLYAYTWVGWWLIYLVVAVFFISVFADNILLYFRDFDKLKKRISPYFISFSAFFAGSIIFCLFIARIEPFSFIYNSVCENLGLGKSLHNSIWPSVYYTVSELKAGNVLTIPLDIGGWFLFVLAVFSLLVVYIKERRSEKAHVVTLFVFWTLCVFFVSLKGARFTLLFSLPLGIFLGAGLEKVVNLVFLKTKRLQSIKLKIGIFLCGAVALFLFFSPPLRRGIVEARVQIPMMNDAWHNFLSRIKGSTPQNCVINSWWDHGNWIKEISQRKVIFDPQSQNRPLAYWMARVLLTDNEEEAVKILRMLNNSSDKLFEEIENHIGDEFKSIVLLQKLLKADFKDADKIFQGYQLPSGFKEKIKDIIFLKKPPPAYFVIDRTMSYKMGGISFLGNWSFPKVYIMKHRFMPEKHILDNLKKTFSLSCDKGKILYDEVILSATRAETNEVLSERWIFNTRLGKGDEKAGVVYFDNGVVLRLSDLEARIFSLKEKKYKKFKYTFSFDGKDLIRKEHKSAELKSGGLFFKDEEKWQYVGLSFPELGRSLYSRLYFLKAKGLKYFEPFISDDEAGIYAFKIKWAEDKIDQ